MSHDMQRGMTPPTTATKADPARPDPRPLLTWAAIILAVVAFDSLAGAVFGVSLGLGSARGEGRIALMLIAASAAIRFMSRELRPLADFGLVARSGWQARFLATTSLSALAAGSVLLAGAVIGPVGFSGEIWRSTLINPLLTALIAAALLAYTQEIVYRGFVDTELAAVFGAASAPVTALIYGLTFHFEPGLWAAPGEWLPLVIGLTLAGLVLQMARRAFGSLIAPIGMVTGWLAVGIFARRSELVTGAGDAPWFWILAPADTPALLAAVWLALAVMAAVFWRMARRGPRPAKEQPAAAGPGLASSLFGLLNRYNPFSSLMALAPVDVLLHALVRARFRIHPFYLPRLVWMLLVSTATTILNLPERFLLPAVIRTGRHPDPVFVLGVHRSGTTHLHNLLSLDPRFVAPTTYHVFNPTGFVLAGRVIGWLFGALLPWQRPFDSMELSLSTPNEDEFAICNSSIVSPYWSFVFPRAADDFDRYIYGARFTASERRSWQRTIRVFLAKVTLFGAKTPLLKSPYHTACVGLISDTFPDARFVHIVRNPLHVHRSNMKLEADGLPVFTLQTTPKGAGHAARFLDEHYAAIEAAYREEAARLPEGRVAEIRYEDLLADPMGEIERVYDTLDLEMTPSYRARLTAYLATVADYKPNRYRRPSTDEQARVEAKLAPLIDLWGYRETLG